VPTGDGWLTLHASLEEGSSDRVAIVIERARGSHVAPLRLESYQLTARERELATLLVQGLSHAEIATQLVLSPHTVRDHVKSIYEKTGVSSRREFIARVFLEDYLPQMAQQTPLGSDGRFRAEPGE
jgi:DNA-binding NarL/FixJ family response regulator